MSAPGTAGGSFSFTASAPGTYAFATVASDAAGNVEALPASPDATTVVSAPVLSKRITIPVTAKVNDFVTAVFQPPYLYLRLKCPARFKPGCIGSALAVTAKDQCTTHGGKPSCKHGSPMSSSTSANQGPNKWKVVKLQVKPQFTSRVLEMSKKPDQKLLTVRQSIHAKAFEDGRPQTVFHTYRVRAASSS